MALLMQLFTAKTGICELYQLGHVKADTRFLLDAAIQNGYEKEGAVTWTHATRQPYMLLSRNVRQIRNMSLEPLGNMVIGLDPGTGSI